MQAGGNIENIWAHRFSAKQKARVEGMLVTAAGGLRCCRPPSGYLGKKLLENLAF